MKKRLRKKKIKENLRFLDDSWGYDFNKEYFATVDPIYEDHKPSEVYTKYTPYVFNEVQQLVKSVIDNLIADILSMIEDYKE